MSKINNIKIKQEDGYSEAIALGAQKYSSSADTENEDLYLSTKGSDKVFEPSLPAQPATKKYVDDQKGIIPVNPDNTDNINIWISDAE